MHDRPESRITRREWLRLSAGALLALGVWPGCARWSGRRTAGAFSFVVINDAHFQSPQCPAWFERVSANIRAQPSHPEFCLMVISRNNHDGTPEKGYFLCTAREGQVHREFVEVKPA